MAKSFSALATYRQATNTLRVCSYLNGVNGNSANAETQFTSQPAEAAEGEFISQELRGKVEVLIARKGGAQSAFAAYGSGDLVQLKGIGSVDRSEDSFVDAGDAADVSSPVPEGARSRRIREIHGTILQTGGVGGVWDVRHGGRFHCIHLR